MQTVTVFLINCLVAIPVNFDFHLIFSKSRLYKNVTDTSHQHARFVCLSHRQSGKSVFHFFLPLAWRYWFDKILIWYLEYCFIKTSYRSKSYFWTGLMIFSVMVLDWKSTQIIIFPDCVFSVVLEDIDLIFLIPNCLIIFRHSMLTLPPFVLRKFWIVGCVQKNPKAFGSKNHQIVE